MRMSRRSSSSRGSSSQRSPVRRLWALAVGLVVPGALVAALCSVPPAGASAEFPGVFGGSPSVASGSGTAAGGLPGAVAAMAAALQESKVVKPVPLLELRTAGNVGWMWTLSEAEASSAVSAYGMSLQASHLGYLRRQAFTGSQPIFRLKVNSRSAYLLTASTAERDALVKSGRFTYEGILGYAAKTKLRGTAELWRMSNGAEWRVVPDAQKAAFTARGYKTDGPLGYVYPRFDRTGAIYFGTFDAHGNQALLDNVQRVYGRRDWWGGVKDFAGTDVQKNAWHWQNQDWSFLKPSIGYYDDSKPATLEKQITQATGAGLDHFVFYWYWNPANGGGENYVAGLKAFLQARNRSKMNFAIMPCLHPWTDGPVSLKLPNDQIDKAAKTIVDNYLGQSNYLRANDGRPIIEVCDVRGIGSGDPNHVDNAATRRFTDAIRAEAKAKFGENVLITRNSDLGIDDAATGFEGQQCMGQYDTSRSYPTYVDKQRAYFAAKKGVLIRCATSGFDERPRIGILIPDPKPPTEANLKAAFRWFDGQSLDQYKRLLGLVQQDIDTSTRAPLVDNFVLLYAWNEWHEGGHIEPNARDGCAYLNAVKAQLHLPYGSGCVPNPAG